MTTPEEHREAAQQARRTYQVEETDQRTGHLYREALRRHGGPAQEELEQDHHFFKEHAGRRHRVRDAFPHEDQLIRLMDILTAANRFQPQDRILVLVRRQSPGVNLRFPIALPQGDSADTQPPEDAGEEEAHRLFEEATRDLRR